MADSTFFTNRDCEYFPCHADVPEQEFNCMFCFCPLYERGDACGGDFVYTATGKKDCSGCVFPHRRENYPLMLEKLK